MIIETDELASLLELCYGDVDDDAEGLADLRVQLDAYPDRAERFRVQLATLALSGDEDTCRALLQASMHRFVPGAQAMAWLRDLAQHLG